MTEQPENTQANAGKTDQDERRVHTREDRYHPIIVTVVDPDGGIIAVLEDADLLNISAGGMAVSTETPISLNDKLVIRGYNLDEDQPVVLRLVGCSIMSDKRYKLRCEVIEGIIRPM